MEKNPGLRWIDSNTAPRKTELRKGLEGPAQRSRHRGFGAHGRGPARGGFFFVFCGAAYHCGPCEAAGYGGPRKKKWPERPSDVKGWRRLAQGRPVRAPGGAAFVGLAKKTSKKTPLQGSSPFISPCTCLGLGYLQAPWAQPSVRCCLEPKSSSAAAKLPEPQAHQDGSGAAARADFTRRGWLTVSGASSASQKESIADKGNRTNRGGRPAPGVRGIQLADIAGTPTAKAGYFNLYMALAGGDSPGALHRHGRLNLGDAGGCLRDGPRLSGHRPLVGASEAGCRARQSGARARDLPGALGATSFSAAWAARGLPRFGSRSGARRA